MAERRRTSSSASGGFARITRRTGSGVRPGSPRGPARPPDRRVVPGEAELVRPVVLVGDEVDELERLEREEAVGDAGRDLDPVGRRARGSRRPALPPGRRAAAGRRRARRTRGRSPTTHRSSWRRWRCSPRRTPAAEVDRLAWTKPAAGNVRRAPQLAERAAPVAVARDRAVGHAGQRGRRAGGSGGRSGAVMGGSRAGPRRAQEGRRVVGHRVRPRAHRLAGRQRRRREDAPARRP